jgi:signal transduction histidine kinase
MTGVLLAIAGALAGLVLGWSIGARRKTADPRAAELRRLADDLEVGRRTRIVGDESPEVLAVIHALERSWAPRNEERERLLQEALGRIAAFLREQLRGPLQDGLRAGSQQALEDAAERALGGLDDLEFFLREPLTPDEVHNLVPLVQQVTREFTSDWEVMVRLATDDRPVPAHIQKDMFLDAVYLLLHNAGQFGKGEPIDVTVTRDGADVRVLIRDRGPGFSPEALERAHDLFYTTSPAGLGLGIPFARKIVESFGGEIRLRNSPRGGAEVELVLPAA